MPPLLAAAPDAKHSDRAAFGGCPRGNGNVNDEPRPPGDTPRGYPGQVEPGVVVLTPEILSKKDKSEIMVSNLSLPLFCGNQTHHEVTA